MKRFLCIIKYLSTSWGGRISRSSNGYLIVNIPKYPLLRKPVSYVPALNVASACHRDEEGSFFLYVSYPKTNEEKKKSLWRVFYTKPQRHISTPRYAILGISRSVALVNQAIIQIVLRNCRLNNLRWLWFVVVAVDRNPHRRRRLVLRAVMQLMKWSRPVLTDRRR